MQKVMRTNLTVYMACFGQTKLEMTTQDKQHQPVGLSTFYCIQGMYLSYITMSHRFLAYLQISTKKGHETCLSPLKNERRASLLYARDQQTILSRRKILLQS